MIKILYISGSRADYGPARRLLKAIHADQVFELGILVTGMHLDPLHGETWREIETDGLNIVEKIYGRLSGDSLSAMAASIGLYLYSMSYTIEKVKPDIVLLLGDRGEQLAGAMAAAFQNITVVHLCGGSISGSIDDSIRHAITKFAHYHYPGFDEHAKRIIQMGEDPQRVKVVGLPGGNINPDVTYTRGEISEMYSLPEDKPYLLVVQHSVTQTQIQSGAQITETLEAVSSLDYPVLLSNSNDDAGGKAILNTMKEYAEKYHHMQILKPPRSRELFASIMAHAGVLVGNSSSALVEAMSVQTPVVNIGDRQRGREHLALWLNVNYDRNEILINVKKAINDEAFKKELQEFAKNMLACNHEELVVEELKKIDIKAGARSKLFVDLNQA